MPTRFSNKEKLYIYRFSDLFLVRCPRCDKQAKVILRDLNTSGEEIAKGGWGALIFAARRVVCVHCGYTAEWHHRMVSYVEGEDWYFHLPLWLQTPCCGEVLWAFNPAHLDFIEEFVRAEIRDSRGNETLASRLPGWMKSGGIREEVLRCVQKLRSST
jgi:hypothetical protein